ncbi:MAG: hypothetical protein AB2385_13960 [Symbiobacterium sp.]|uniref:hypothetical protein n=1 Tax=Symbiobacterium sp. TaxID=1971213 RepID=UPI003463BD1E
MTILHRPAEWYRNVLVGSAALSVAVVPIVALLLHGHLPLWLHIPLVGCALTLMALSALAAGAAAAEFRGRSAQTPKAE